MPNCNSEETPKEKEIMQKLTKEKVRAELSLQKLRYGGQLKIRHPENQENSIKYQTCYRNVSNWDQVSRGTNCRSNTRHKGEHHRYNRNSM